MPFFFVHTHSYTWGWRKGQPEFAWDRTQALTHVSPSFKTMPWSLLLITLVWLIFFFLSKVKVWFKSLQINHLYLKNVGEFLVEYFVCRLFFTSAKKNSHISQFFHLFPWIFFNEILGIIKKCIKRLDYAKIVSFTRTKFLGI